MPRTPRNSPNPPGRPPKTAQVAEALRIVEKTGESIEEAARRAGVNPDTVYAHKAKGAAPRGPGASRAPQGPPLAIPPGPSAPIEPPALSAPPDPRAAALRRMIAKGDFAASSVAQLAAGLGCEPLEVLRLLGEAAHLAAAEVLPPALAREQSLEMARAVKSKALEAADWKSALEAQKHIDALLIPREQKGPAPKGDVIPRSDVVATLRRVREAVAPWPEASVAMRAALGAT